MDSGSNSAIFSFVVVPPVVPLVVDVPPQPVIAAAAAGCGTAEKARREAEMAALVKQVEELKKGQDQIGKDVGRLAGELKALDAQAAFLVGETKAAATDRDQLKGAGQQQVRFVWANIGAFHICLWTFTMTEAWAWRRPEEELVDRTDSPWDDPNRRPSHADKRLAWRRELLGEEIRAALRPGATEAEIQATAERLLSLAA